MVKASIHIPLQTAMALRQLSALQGRSQSELIRNALTIYTRQTARPAPKGLGKYRSGEPDVARRAKDILSAAARRGGWR